MAKMITFVCLLSVFIIQVSSNETPLELENSTNNHDPASEERLLISGIVSRKCKALISAQSSAAPTLKVTITRLANGRAYYFAPLGTTLTFNAANKFCQDHGMHLVTLNSELENTLVYAEAKRLLYTGVAGKLGAWIGMRDTTGGGSYNWVQPKVGTTPVYFGSGFPVGGQCAGYIDGLANPEELAWVSFDCVTTTIPFICEMEEPCSLFV